jgi:predicted amidophosphoribosyltransferase
VIECPDCTGQWDTEREPACPRCGLSLEDLETAADFLAEQELRG